MSFSRSVESQDNALTDASPVKSNARALATGSWWRFSRYEIRDGYIRPALGARLRRYDPWKRWLKTRAVSRRSDGSVRGATPYRELLELLNKLEYRSVGADSPEFTPAQVDMLAGPLTADSEQRILRWCARYGLLGILQHRLLQVVLSPRNDAQVEYRRISLGWAAVERARENPFTPILEPHAVVQPLRGVGLTAEPLSETWARFFPAVPAEARDTFAYPQPLTNSFWEMYAEPLQDFLSGARALMELLSAVQMQTTRKLRSLHELTTGGGLPIVIQGLVAPTGVAVRFRKNGRTELDWVGGSLLASLTMMMLQDLSFGRAVQCPCGQLLVSSAYQARYCSRRCRWRFEQRKHRKR